MDVEAIDAINMDNETFLERNFTEQERTYCRAAASPQSSFAGRWSAKEAVFKSLGVCSKGAGAPLKDIEVLSDETGAPVVKVSSNPITTLYIYHFTNLESRLQLNGEAAAAAKKAGVKEVSVSISHSDSQAVAIAMSKF